MFISRRSKAVLNIAGAAPPRSGYRLYYGIAAVLRLGSQAPSEGTALTGDSGGAGGSCAEAPEKS